ncbi:hypothetical protein EAI_13341, partial [Harpegnathos saltator]
AVRTLGFINRTSMYFKNMTTITSLYITLVRPHLEYGSVL